ncbi:hypothetical protein Tco_1006444 [Tanacetum coccineum]|uniref:Uncharacterized protein n=1 Tax=Tanacetum coccineum TaxID=301880 RepID=A0ABQ5FI41_9ASTR
MQWKTQSWKEKREPTFQVVLDALALTPCYSALLITADVPEVYIYQFWDIIHKYENSYRFKMDKKKKFDLNLEIFRDIFQICPRVHVTDIVVDQMHQPWRTFATIINRSLSGKTTGLDKLRLSRAQILWGMYYKKNVDYVKQQRKQRLTRLTLAMLHELHLLRRHKSSRSLLLLNSLLSQLHLKNPQGSVIIRETPMKYFSKKKEKMTVEKRKGINLLSEVALTKEAQYEEVCKKSLRDFHKTHPSGSGTVTKITPSAVKIKPSVTNEGTGVKPKVPGVIEEESTKSEAESWGKDEDDSNNDHDSISEGNDQERDNEENEEEVEDDEEEKDDKFVKTSSNSTDKEDETNKESKVENKAEGDEDKGMDYPTNQFDDDVDQGNENLETTLNQVIEDAHVTLSTIAKKTEVPVTSSSHSFDLASKFLNFLDIPHIDAEIVSPMDVHVHHEVSISALEKDVAKLKKDDLLNTQVTALVDEHLDSRLGATRASQDSILAKDSSQPQSTYEVAASLTEFELKKILIDKMDESQSYLTAAEHIECYDGLIKSYDLDKSLFSTYDKADEPEFEVADSDMPQDQEENLGNDDEEPKRKTPQQGPTQSWLMTIGSSADKLSKTFDELMSTPIDFSAYIMNGLKITNLTQETLLRPAFKLLKGTRTNFAELEYDLEECYKALLEKLDWENLKGGDYPFDITKPLPLVMNGSRQMVPVDHFFNNDLKYLQGEISTMTYTTSTTKTKAAQYDLQGIEDMVPNIWTPVKVAYDKYALWGISHWRKQCKTFYAYIRGLESSHDGADNELYIFKEGNFLRLCINDIEDMLILIVQNRLTNLLGDDVSDFAITL